MLRFLIILLAIYLFFRLGKILLKWYLHKKFNFPSQSKPHNPVNERFKDAADAEFTDIPDPDKKKDKDD